MDSRPVSKLRVPQAGLAEMNSAKTNSRSGLKAPGFATSGMKPSGIASVFQCFISMYAWCLTQSQKRPPISHPLPPPEYPTDPHVLTPERTRFLRRSLPERPSPEQRRPPHFLRLSDRALVRQLQPYTSLDTHEEESPSSVLGKRKGRQHFPKSYQVTPGSYDKYMNCTIQLTPSPSPSHTPNGPPPQRRDPSISTLMSKLSLSEPKDTPIEQATLANKARNIPLRSGNTRLPLRQAKSTCQLTYTPPRRKPKSLQKTPSIIVPFLTKSSQLKAWEHDTRLQELETFADTFFSKISQVGQNSDVMKDAINLYKSRGTYFTDDKRSSLTFHSGGARKEPGRNYGQQLHASY